MFKSYKYRIYPTDAQKVLLEKHFGCVRFVYNLALETKQMAYSGAKSNLTAYDLHKQLTDLKKDCIWLSEVSIGALQHSILDMDKAYKGFFNGGGYPSFKKKTSAGAFKCTNTISIVGGKLRIPKFKPGIAIIQHRAIPGEIRSATITKTSTGKYIASIFAEVENTPLPINETPIGIDLGIKTFAVLSDGKEYASPKFLRKSMDRLAILQRRASRKKKGSANRKKANLKIALLHERATNRRKDFLHKTSNEITNQYGVICIEDLNVAGMGKNHKLAQSINDASWSAFTTMLAYKSEWKGRQLIKIGRFDPTSKTCSGCGKIKDMPLIERTYNCECGLSMDRDLNAAINIRNSGLLRAGVPVELPTLVGAVKQEKCMPGIEPYKSLENEPIA